MNDVRKMIYGTIIGFFVMLGVWFSIVYVSACGFTLTCHQGDQIVVRTPIPTLIPVSQTEMRVETGAVKFDKCQIAAVDLIGAWVSSGYPEKDKFQFTDAKGTTCAGTFSKDVQPLFRESNIWYPGSLACASCHLPDLAKAQKNLDLSSFTGIVAGSGRANGEAKGNDILGGGNWDKALLYQMLYAPDGKTLIGRPPMPFGRGADVPANGPLVYAGQPLTSASSETTNQATETPSAPAEVARPSNPGGPGDAINLTGNADAGAQIYALNCVTCHNAQGVGGEPNPGSTDGTVPELNPIDLTLKSPDYKTFATNLDLFVEHGSTPEGTNPILSMPAWGDKKWLTSQQIADVIAYIISLNK